VNKEFAVYGIIAVVAILGLLFYQQQSQIDELENQLQLDRELEACRINSYLNVDVFQNCALESFKIYGTPEQYVAYRDSIEQAEQDAIRQEISDKERLRDWEMRCHEKYIGMPQDVIRCIEWGKIEFNQYP